MTDKELKKLLADMRITANEACASRESARDFLVKIGIMTKSGKLAKPYR